MGTMRYRGRQNDTQARVRKNTKRNHEVVPQVGKGHGSHADGALGRGTRVCPWETSRSGARLEAKTMNTTRGQEIIQICAWCEPTKLVVLNAVEQSGLIFRVNEHTGLVVRVTRGDADLLVSHGICPECAAQLKKRTALGGIGA